MDGLPRKKSAENKNKVSSEGVQVEKADSSGKSFEVNSRKLYLGKESRSKNQVCLERLLRSTQENSARAKSTRRYRRFAWDMNQWNHSLSNMLSQDGRFVAASNKARHDSRLDYLLITFSI